MSVRKLRPDPKGVEVLRASVLSSRGAKMLRVSTIARRSAVSKTRRGGADALGCVLKSNLYRYPQLDPLYRFESQSPARLSWIVYDSTCHLGNEPCHELLLPYDAGHVLMLTGLS